MDWLILVGVLALWWGLQVWILPRLGVLLGIYVNANFLWFTLFVGVNLFQSAFTNWCPMMVILRKGGLPDAHYLGTRVASGR